MQITALLPIIALLVAPIADARTGHQDNAAAAKRHIKHVRNHEKMADQVARREQLAAENPRAMRKVKRGANGCRVRGQNFTASAATPATSSATSAVITSASAAAVEASAAAGQASAPASAAYSEASPAASDAVAGSGNNWVQPSDSATSSAAPAASSAAAPPKSNGGNAGGLTPGGKKAGASGVDTLELFKPHISWFWNYGTTRDTQESDLTFVPTVWGNGQQGEQDASRLASFQNIDWTPQYVQGFYEPDCSPPMSSAIDPWVAAPLWNSLISPYRNKGALLLSPGLCKQADDDWLTPFKNAIGDNNMWDITSVHINKLDMAGAKLVLDHYWNTYGKPMWVTEFACVDDKNGFVASEDQAHINGYINDIVDLLQNDDRVYAYSMSEGMGLGNTWPPFKDGQLTESGRTYLNAISKY